MIDNNKDKLRLVFNSIQDNYFSYESTKVYV